MRKLQRLISLAMVLAILLSLLCITSFAEDEKKITVTTNITDVQLGISVAQKPNSGKYYDVKNKTWEISGGSLVYLYIDVLAFDSDTYELKGITINGTDLSSGKTFQEFRVTIDPEPNAQWGYLASYMLEAPSSPSVAATIPESWDIVLNFRKKPIDASTADYAASAADGHDAYVSTQYYGKSDGADEWVVRASAAPDGFEFDHWTWTADEDADWDDDWDAAANPLTVLLTEESGDVTFTPVFRMWDVSLLDGFKLNELYVGANEIYGYVAAGEIGNGAPRLYASLITDTSALCSLCFSMPNSLPENDTAKFVVRLYAGDSVDERKALGRTEFVASALTAGEHYFQMRLDDIPTDLEKITAAVEFSTNAGTRELQVRTYDVPAAILSVREGDALRYVENNGSYITMAAAGVDAVTGQLNLVMSNGAGFFTLADGSLKQTSMDVSALTGLSTVYDLASAPDGTIWTYIASTAGLPAGNYRDGYTYHVGYLASYDGETWTLHTDSKLYEMGKQETKYDTCAAADVGQLLPLDGGTVLTKDKTWDGSAWQDGGHGKDNIVQMDGSFYAVDAAGAYVFDAGTRSWTLLSNKVQIGQYDQLHAANGILAVAHNTGNAITPTYTDMTLLDVQSKAVTEISTEIFGTSQPSKIYAVGLSYDGTPYFYYYGPTYNNNNDRSTTLCRYEDGAWVHVKEADFWTADEDPNQFATKIRPVGINVCMNPASGVTLHGALRSQSGWGGSLYLETGETTITFDANGGTLNGTASLTGSIYDEIPVSFQTTAARAGYIFDGWSYDAEGTTTWDKNSAVFPAKDITLYAKWKDASASDDPLAYHRQSALESLQRQYEKYDKTDYSEANWAKLEQAYQAGIEAINAATVAEGDYPENNVIAELNAALQAMGAITPDRAGKIDVIVSMDAQTLGLGYFIKPTLITIDKYTQASTVITDMIIEACKEQYDPDFDWQGYQTYHESEPEGTYAYMRTGTVTNSFYLAQVYWPNQQDATVADYILSSAGEIDYSAREGRYLGEFDYHNMSGWMYSISSSYDDELPSFPGVGAADWRLSDGEVMRWQFTVWGYGADLNADNSEWGQASITGDSGDKTDLTVMVAELRSIYGDDLLESNQTYVDVFYNVLCDPVATQDELDGAVAKREQIEAELADAYAAQAVKQLIEEIGLPQNVTLESKPAIDAARNAYEALTDEQKTLFAEKYPDALDDLEAAEARYAELVKQAEQEEIDRAAANGVIELIQAIGGVDSVTRSSGPAIQKARNAYDALTDAQKDLVGEWYDELVACETAFAALPNPVLPPVTPSKPSTPAKPTEPVSTVSFRDVAKSDWYYDAVQYVSEKGLMTGTGTNRFSPDVTTTRGMIVTILYRVEEEPAVYGSSSFDDVKAGAYYEKAVIWAAENGIVTGYSDSRFGPDDSITREQLAAILYRYAKYKGYDVSKSNDLSRFTDSDKVSDWALTAMRWANAESLITGKGNLLDPQGKATRAETAAILMRFMKNVAKLDD